MRIPALFLICGGLALSNAALAQNIASAGGAGTTVTASSGTDSVLADTSAYDQLSRGNQRIAESLFQGQVIPSNGTGTAWSLDKIAAAKQHGQGWGQIFKQMKADGLIEAKNLGQLVSGHSTTVKHLALATKTRTPVETSKSDTTTADTTDTGATAPSVTEVAAATPKVASEVGAFDKLSPGNKRIAESLFESQVITGDGTVEAMSLDQIAVASRNGQGWGQIFSRMKSAGLLQAKNLGQLVSGHGAVLQTASYGAWHRSEIVLTNGNGKSMSFEMPDRQGNAANSNAHAGYQGGKKVAGLTSGSGGYGNGIANGGRGASRSSKGRSGK